LQFSQQSLEFQNKILPTYLVILHTHKSLIKNALQKIACRTGCKTAVWISLPEKYYV